MNNSPQPIINNSGCRVKSANGALPCQTILLIWKGQTTLAAPAAIALSSPADQVSNRNHVICKCKAYLENASICLTRRPCCFLAFAGGTSLRYHAKIIRLLTTISRRPNENSEVRRVGTICRYWRAMVDSLSQKRAADGTNFLTTLTTN